MKNRYGDQYEFVKIKENVYTIEGDLKWWRYGGKEGAEGLDYTDLGFVDPSGGPFISVGSKIEGRPVTRISAINEKIFFEVDPGE
jgi:hypothetical protein